MSQQSFTGSATPVNGQVSVTALSTWTLRKIILATMTVLVVTLLFALFYRFYHVIFLLFVAIAIQIALDPLVRWLTQRGIGKGSAVFAIYLVIFAVIATALWYGAVPLVDQTRDVLSTLPRYYAQMRESGWCAGWRRCCRKNHRRPC